MPSSIHFSYSRGIALFLIPLALAGCSSTPKPPARPEASPSQQASIPKAASAVPALPPAGSGRGAYYLDDGPGDDIPDGLHELPDAQPAVEPYSKYGNRPYVVFGKRYTPFTDDRPFKQRGKGSWYGKKFHGQRTSSGEPYDMYKMTAAHPTLPLPSYARVTNLGNGKQVIVRVNDRGPFHSGRIIDLSYVAALKLGYLQHGSANLEVERLLPDEIARITADTQVQSAEATSVPSMVTVAAKRDGEGAAPLLDGTGKPEAGSSTPEGNALAPGFYVQFGAYAQRANAEAVHARLAQKWEGAMQSLKVVESGSLYRLHSGPFATRAEAAMAALQVENAGVGKPVIVQR